MSFKIRDGLTWVGKIDWELRTFHGEEYSTHKGTSYNSYLIQDEKTVLLDTVWMPFAHEFIQNLEREIPLTRIDALVITHGEVDHSGALPELMKKIPNVPIYCTANAVKSLKGQYHQDWNFKVVKTGDKLNLGSKELIFVEAPMLHWPDTMFAYMTNDNILFSSDAFGQHYASALMYNDLVDQGELYQECTKYYANILTPLSKFVDKKIKEVVGLNLPVDMICSSHGVIWRDNPLQIVTQYAKWALEYQENQITIIYDTMWNGTRRMAEEIAKGIQSVDDTVVVKLFNSAKADKNDIISEVFKSKAIILGSPTVYKGVLSSIAGIMEEIKGLDFKNKKAAAFGAYGWSGEGTKVLSSLLQSSGFTLVNDGLRELWNPNEQAIENCKNFGRNFLAMIK